MRALHHVVTKGLNGNRAGAVFTGTKIPVRALLDHLDHGGALDDFLDKHRALPRDQALAALALGLEALLEQVPTETPPAQRSLLPRTDPTGAVINAEELRADQVVDRRLSETGSRIAA